MVAVTAEVIWRWGLLTALFLLLAPGCSYPQLSPYEGLPRLGSGGEAVVGPAGGIVALGGGVELWVPRGEVAAGGLLVSLEAVPLPEQISGWSADPEERMRGSAYRLLIDSTGALAAGGDFEFLLRFSVADPGLAGGFVFPFQEVSGRVFEIPVDGASFNDDWLVLPGRLAPDSRAEAVAGVLAYGVEYCLANGGEWVISPGAMDPVVGYCQAPWGEIWLNSPPKNGSHVLAAGEMTDAPYSPRLPVLTDALGAVTANLGNLDMSVRGKAVDPYVLQRLRNSLSLLQPDLLALQELGGPDVVVDLLAGGGYDFFCAGSGYDCLAWKEDRFDLAAAPETVVGGLAPDGVGSFMELPPGQDIDEYAWCNGDTGAAMVRLREVASGREFAALSIHTATSLAATPQIPCREQQLISFLRASGVAEWVGDGWRAGGGPSLWLGDFNIDPERGSAPNFGAEAADARRLRWLADWSAQTGLPPGGIASVSGLLALRSDNRSTHATSRSYDHVLASRDLLDDWSCTVPPAAREGRLEVGSGLADRWTLDAEGLRLWNEYLNAGGIDLTAVPTPLSPDHRPVYCSLRFAPAP